MKLLAIDTATPACSAALHLGSELLLEEKLLPRGHGEAILGMVHRLLANAGVMPTELDAVAFGRGPGSFTGLRIAAGVTQGIALGADLPVVAISNLAALALKAARQLQVEQILPAFDARMGELYWAGYHINAEGSVNLQICEAVTAPEHAELPPSGRWVGVGDGWQSHGTLLRERCGERLTAEAPDLLCSAREIATLGMQKLRAGELCKAEEAMPIYLRNQVARIPQGVNRS